jgi:hypothetical protein
MRAPARARLQTIQRALGANRVIPETGSVASRGVGRHCFVCASTCQPSSKWKHPSELGAWSSWRRGAVGPRRADPARPPMGSQGAPGASRPPTPSPDGTTPPHDGPRAVPGAATDSPQTAPAPRRPGPGPRAEADMNESLVYIRVSVGKNASRGGLGADSGDALFQSRVVLPAASRHDGGVQIDQFTPCRPELCPPKKKIILIIIIRFFLSMHLGVTTEESRLTNSPPVVQSSARLRRILLKRAPGGDD